MIIGALRKNKQYAGAVTVIYGKSLQISPVVVTDRTMKAIDGFTITGSAWTWFGYSVSGAGITEQILLKLK